MTVTSKKDKKFASKGSVGVIGSRWWYVSCLFDSCKSDPIELHELIRVLWIKCMIPIRKRNRPRQKVSLGRRKGKSLLKAWYYPGWVSQSNCFGSWFYGRCWRLRSHCLSLLSQTKNHLCVRLGGRCVLSIVLPLLFLLAFFMRISSAF